jgi:hypothetical protein
MDDELSESIRMNPDAWGLCLPAGWARSKDISNGILRPVVVLLECNIWICGHELRRGFLACHRPAATDGSAGAPGNFTQC